MPKSRVTRRGVTAGEALYVIDRLIKERRLKPSEVTRLVRDMHREIADLEQRLAALRQAAESARPPENAARFSSRQPRKKPVTPEVARSRRLQGEYMGLLRHIRGSARARMKKLANDQGREAAVKAMRDLVTG
jgi:anti-sigma-K factor RskA